MSDPTFDQIIQSLVNDGLKHCDVLIQVNEKILTQVLRAFYVANLAKIPVSTDPERYLYLTTPEISYPSPSQITFSTKLRYELYSNGIGTVEVSVALTFKLFTAIDGSKSNTSLKFDALYLADKFIVQTAFGTVEQTEEQINTTLLLPTKLMGKPDNQTPLAFLNQKISGMIAGKAGSISLNSFVEKYQEYAGIKLERIVGQFKQTETAYIDHDLLLGLNFKDSNLPGKIDNAKSILMGTDTIGVAIGENVLQTIAKKCEQKYLGTIAEDVKLTKLKFDLESGGFRLNGKIEWDTWLATFEISFETTVAVSLKDGQIIFKITDMDLEVDFWFEWLVDILFGFIPWLLLEVGEWYAGNEIEGLDIAQMMGCNLQELLYYSFDLPMTDQKMTLQMNNMQVYQNGIILSGFTSISPQTVLTDGFPEPEPPSCKLEFGLYADKIKKKVINGTWTIDKELHLLEPHEWDALLAFINDPQKMLEMGMDFPATKEELYSNFETVHISYSSQQIKQYIFHGNANPKKFSSKLTYKWFVNEKQADLQTKQMYSDYYKPVDWFPIGRPPYDANDVGFRVNHSVKCIVNDTIASYNGSYIQNYPVSVFESTILEIYPGKKKEDWSNYVTKKGADLSILKSIKMTEAILMAALQIEEGQTMMVQDDNGDPQPMENIAQLAQFLQQNVAAKDLNKALSQFSKAIMNNVKVISSTKALSGSSATLNAQKTAMQKAQANTNSNQTKSIKK